MAASATLNPLGLDLNATIGALLLGGLVSAILYGITSTQTVVYFQRYRGDCLGTRAAVVILWLLDSFDMCLIAHILYWYLITNYGNVLSLVNPVWSVVLHILVTSLTQTVVRGMFAVRVWRLGQGLWIPPLAIMALSSSEFVIAIVLTVKALNSTFEELQKLDAMVYAEFITGFCGDLLVALCLCYFLQKARTGFKQTECMINILMAYVINTGLFTALTSSVCLILFAAKPGNFIYVAVYFQSSKLYANAYLGMLNAREAVREHSGNGIMSIHASQFSNALGDCHKPSVSYTVRACNLEEPPMTIQVETDVDTMTDAPRPKLYRYSESDASDTS